MTRTVTPNKRAITRQATAASHSLLPVQLCQWSKRAKASNVQKTEIQTLVEYAGKTYIIMNVMKHLSHDFVSLIENHSMLKVP